jgi:hypothetical protein
MKVSLLLIIVLALLGGLYFYTTTRVDAPAETREVVEETVDTPVPTTSAPAQIAVYENSDYGFTFKYRIKPYGYSIFENNAQQNLDMETLFGMTLIRSDDYNESVKAAAEGNAHDGPPAMSVYVFSASKALDLEAWMVGKRMITNCMEGQVTVTMLAGQDASVCLWDGLYPGVTIAQIRNNRIYVLIGTREGAETPDGYSYENDFNAVVESFGVRR